MPTRTFAVRVKRARPTRNESTTKVRPARALPDLLPAGEGRYVDDTHTDSETYPDTDYKGNPTEKVRYFATAFDEDVDFPLQGVMPEVLRATSRAMALRLFDQLGVVQNDGGRDPIVVGQLLDPRGPAADDVLRRLVAQHGESLTVTAIRSTGNVSATPPSVGDV